jgi:S-adenosylmethionine synthetase
VAIETLVTTGLCRRRGGDDHHRHRGRRRVVRDTIRRVGYTRAKYGYDGETCAV